MTRYVVDAPTLLRLVTGGRPVHPAHHLVAPGAIRSQALELLLEDVRAGRLREAEALERHERVTAVRIRLLGDPVSRRTAWRLARERDLGIAQAEHLALAMLQADALVTEDAGLAAQAAGLVPLARVEDLAAG
ncbi:MAG TPA: hypothetical protein VES95_09815 [Dermatophilaceae bacterium]|nr:hypothetical protein [Dermatophilaceae bacterium]